MRLLRPGADQIFINSYDDDYDPVNGTRFYKHYQETNLCQRPQSTPDSEWNYWQLHHCLLADLSGYDQRDPAMADYLINAGKRSIRGTFWR